MESEGPPSKKVKKTTKDHKKEKERLKKLLEKGDASYKPVDKVLVQGENFEEIFEGDTQTYFVKCLNPICQQKSFIEKVKAYFTFWVGAKPISLFG